MSNPNFAIRLSLTFALALLCAFVLPVQHAAGQKQRQKQKQKAAAVFLENVTDPRRVQQIPSETGVKVGGVLYSDALTDENGSAATYIDLIRHNVRELAAALAN